MIRSCADKGRVRVPVRFNRSIAPCSTRWHPTFSLKYAGQSRVPRIASLVCLLLQFSFAIVELLGGCTIIADLGLAPGLAHMCG